MARRQSGPERLRHGAEGFEGGGGTVGLLGRGEGAIGAGEFEVNGVAGGEFPAFGGDLDELRLGVGEVDEDTVGDGFVATTIDAAADDDAGAGGVAGGLGFEVAEDGVPVAGGGDGAELGVAPIEEVFAEVAGAEGEGAGTEAGDGRDAGEGAAIGGGERGDVLEDGVEGVEAGGTFERFHISGLALREGGV